MLPVSLFPWPRTYRVTTSVSNNCSSVSCTFSNKRARHRTDVLSNRLSGGRHERSDLGRGGPHRFAQPYAAAPPPCAGPPGPRGRGDWAAARFVADTPERAEISTSASRPSLLVLTRSWDPGWRARVDGASAPLLRAQLGLVAVVVPAGDHRIELEYSPPSFRVGLALSAAGLLAVLALALAAPPGVRTR